MIALGRLHPDPKTFTSWLPEVLGYAKDDDGVQLSTVHKVKGLEWHHVIVHDATQGLFPHHLSTDIEEERRVFHVAITRGQQSVTVVADAASPSMFLSELEVPAPARTTAAGVGPRGLDGARVGREGRDARGVASLPDVPAAIGLEFTWGGYDVAIAAVEDDSVLFKAGRADVRVPFGSVVSIGGKPGQLVPPSIKAGRATRSKSGSITSGATESENPAVLEALKEWRRARAKDDAVPAYVVATDKTLVEMADLRPTSSRELLAINGIGPAKLERYGDEMLAVIDSAM